MRRRTDREVRIVLMADWALRAPQALGGSHHGKQVTAQQSKIERSIGRFFQAAVLEILHSGADYQICILTGDRRAEQSLGHLVVIFEEPGTLIAGVELGRLVKATASGIRVGGLDGGGWWRR